MAELVHVGTSTGSRSAGGGDGQEPGSDDCVEVERTLHFVRVHDRGGRRGTQVAQTCRIGPFPGDTSVMASVAEPLI